MFDPVAYHRERYLREREHILAISKAYRDANKEKRKELARLYKQNNRGKIAAKEAKRRAYKSNATPPWLSKEQLKQIEAIYEEAQLKGYHVDHIIPLKNKIVCGLHVPWNLQPLPPEENMKKHNTFNSEVHIG